MKVLVTGANGFLGRQVVAELVRRGHQVRALVRPAANVPRLGWDQNVELFRADLRNCPNLIDAFANVDALMHLAATVVGDEDAQLSENVVGTTRLLTAMATSSTRRLVLASSFSVYDFHRAYRYLDEQTPLEGRLYQRDGYAVAKTWQERVARRFSAENRFDLTVIRPGFIWGAGNDYLACLGQSFGPVHLVFGPFTRLPLTHVVNCANCFVTALEKKEASGQTFNVVDDDSVRAWQYMRLYLKGSGARGFRVPIPYLICLALTHIAQRISKWIFNGKGKLPSLLVPIRFEARFKPLRYPNQLVRQLLNWTPPLDMPQRIAQTWPPPRIDSPIKPSASEVTTPAAVPVN